VILVEEKIKLIIEKEVERLYELSQTIGLSEDQVRALKVLYEISKQQSPLGDEKDPSKEIKQVDIMDLLRKVKASERRQEKDDSNDRCGES